LLQLHVWLYLTMMEDLNKIYLLLSFQCHNNDWQYLQITSVDIFRKWGYSFQIYFISKCGYFI
jgi:hypothetical protein